MRRRSLPSRNLRGTNPHHSLRSIFIVNVCFKLRPRKGRLAKSAVSRDIFCSALALGCGTQKGAVRFKLPDYVR